MGIQHQRHVALAGIAHAETLALGIDVPMHGFDARQFAADEGQSALVDSWRSLA